MKSKNKTKKSKKQIIGNNLYLLKKIHKATPGLIAFALILNLLGSVSDVLFNVYVLKFVINGLQTGTPFQSILIFLLAVAAFRLLLCLLSNYYNEIYFPVVNKKLEQALQKEIFAKASSVEIACFESPEFYDKYVKALGEATGRASAVLNSLCEIVSCIFTISAMSFVIFTIDPVLIVFALLPFFLNLFLGKKRNQVRYDYNMQIAEKSRKHNYIRRVFFMTEYAKEIRLSGISKVLFRQFREALADLKQVIHKYGWKIAFFDFIFDFVFDVLVYLGAITFSAYRTLVSKTMLFGDCLVVINSINSVAWSLQGVSDVYVEFCNHSLYIENLRHFLEYEPTIPENPEGLHVPAPSVLSMNNVSFRYTEKGEDVLKGVTLSVRPGEKIALVGQNGAGKTTLVKLLMRLYDVTGGTITYGGVPIGDYRLSEYRDRFATVFQDFRVFSMSVTENVLLKDHMTEKDKQAAVEGMKDSGIWDKVSTLPHGADTILTREFDEKGAVLSGGEAQKIAIARVFAKPCDVVILDEPSSALDPIAEYKMYEAMMRACRDKAVIFISHRLSSAVLADWIYLLDHGQIAEEGTHAELLSRGGKYAAMWEKQAENYREEGSAS